MSWQLPTTRGHRLAGGAGPLTFVGGAGGFDAMGAIRDPGDLGAQIAVALENLADTLAAESCSLDDIVRLKAFYRGDASIDEWSLRAALTNAIEASPPPVMTLNPVPLQPWTGARDPAPGDRTTRMARPRRHTYDDAGGSRGPGSRVRDAACHRRIARRRVLRGWRADSSRTRQRRRRGRRDRGRCRSDPRGDEPSGRDPERAGGVVPGRDQEGGLLLRHHDGGVGSDGGAARDVLPRACSGRDRRSVPCPLARRGSDQGRGTRDALALERFRQVHPARRSLARARVGLADPRALPARNPAPEHDLDRRAGAMGAALQLRPGRCIRAT